MILVSISSVQIGSALATTLFDQVGPAGAVLLRAAFGALILTAIWRPGLRSLSRDDWELTILFGISLAAMNFLFYEAIERIPLGIAVTLEFVGPLSVAVLSSRRRRDLLWVVLAAAGIVILSGGTGGGTDPFGAALALVAGGFWGAYILLGKRVGERFAGGTGLARSMLVATLLLLPFGIAQGGGDFLSPEVLAVGAVVGVVSAAIPFSLELEAMRRLASGVFGVLMSLEPAVASLVGLIALSQNLSITELLGMILVVVASAGALRTSQAPPPIID